jgi:hypothetical protein
VTARPRALGLRTRHTRMGLDRATAVGRCRSRLQEKSSGRDHSGRSPRSGFGFVCSPLPVVVYATRESTAVRSIATRRSRCGRRFVPVLTITHAPHVNSSAVMKYYNTLQFRAGCSDYTCATRKSNYRREISPLSLSWTACDDCTCATRKFNLHKTMSVFGAIPIMQCATLKVFCGREIRLFRSFSPIALLCAARRVDLMRTKVASAQGEGGEPPDDCGFARPNAVMIDQRSSQKSGMVQIVCFGGNLLWCHMKVAFRGAKGETRLPTTHKSNPRMNHAKKAPPFKNAVAYSVAGSAISAARTIWPYRSMFAISPSNRQRPSSKTNW